jgi:ribose-phosphate pyrophosphokinase
MMDLALIAGSAQAALAVEIARRLGTKAHIGAACPFPDGEIHVRLPAVRGADVYLIQSIGPPTHDRLVELLLLADAARRAGAARLTAVVTYLAYARQDRREQEGGPVSAKVIADLIGRSVDRVVGIDLHAPAVEAFFPCPVEHLSATGVLLDSVRPLVTDHVVIAPDLGAMKRAERFARLLGAPTACVRKRRLSGHEVEVLGIEGDVRDRPALVVDDMISTGATIVAAVDALRRSGARAMIVAATHGLFVPPSARTVGGLGLEALFVTDSVPPPPDAPAHTRVSVAAPLSDAIDRMHRELPLGELVRAL